MPQLKEVQEKALQEQWKKQPPLRELEYAIFLSEKGKKKKKKGR